MAFLARADMQTMKLRSSVNFLARAYSKLMKKCWMHDFHARRALDPRSSVRLRVSLARGIPRSNGLQTTQTSGYPHITFKRCRVPVKRENHASSTFLDFTVRSSEKVHARAELQHLHVRSSGVIHARAWTLSSAKFRKWFSRHVCILIPS